MLDVKLALEEVKEETTSGTSKAAPRRNRGTYYKWAVGGAVAALILAAFWLVRMNVRPAQPRRSFHPTYRPTLTGAVPKPFTQRQDAGLRRPDLSQLGHLRAACGRHNPTNLTARSTADDTQPAFSPDGERIAFRSERDGGGIFVMGATGEAVRRLTDFGYNPAWSPDGTQVVVAAESIVRPEDRFLPVSRLWVVDLDTQKVRLLSSDDGVQPSWSPHGHRIAFWASTSGQRDIWTISAEGGKPVPVTQDQHVDWNPVWSPDGRYLYFISDRSGPMNLWRVAIDERSGVVQGTIAARVGHWLRPYPKPRRFQLERTAKRANVLACANYMRRRTATPALTNIGLNHWEKRSWLPGMDSNHELDRILMFRKLLILQSR